ncbi:hypothetical protein LXL04_003976 [Taraxacum kok-saghyz]
MFFVSKANSIFFFIKFNIIKFGDLTEKTYQARYYDCQLIDIQRKLHNIRRCRYIFLLWYEHHGLSHYSQKPKRDKPLQTVDKQNTQKKSELAKPNNTNEPSHALFTSHTTKINVRLKNLLLAGILDANSHLINHL